MKPSDDKTLYPTTIEDLMKLFEVESYKVWAVINLEQVREAEDADESLRETEASLDSAMEEFCRFEEEMNREVDAQLKSLEQMADSVRRLGNSMERATTITSKKYMEVAIKSASMKMFGRGSLPIPARSILLREEYER